MRWVLVLRLPKVGLDGQLHGRETLAFCKTKGRYGLSTGEHDLTMPWIAIENGDALLFDDKALAEEKAQALRAAGTSGNPWPPSWEIAAVETPPSIYTFPPDRRARRIDSTETFRCEITWTREQLAQLADKDCVICLGTGVVERVEPKPCGCCLRDR